MNIKSFSLLKVTSILILSLFQVFPCDVVANQSASHEALLEEIVSTIVQIMHKNGYEMPQYRVRDEGTDVPVSGSPEKHAFFWIRG